MNPVSQGHVHHMAVLLHVLSSESMSAATNQRLVPTPYGHERPWEHSILACTSAHG